MSSTLTPNMSLRKPEHKDPDTYFSWDDVVNGNMNIIDRYIGQCQYSQQNFILNGDPVCQSINSLDLEMKIISDLTPTQDEKNALPGPRGYAPSTSNPYVTLNYLINGPNGDKKLILFPEFSGATFALAPGGNNVGTMLTDSEVVSYGGVNYRFNYYQWHSDEIDELNSYDVCIQFKLPSNFKAFSTTTWAALQIDFKTELNNPTQSKIDVEISKDGTLLTSTISDLVSPDTWYCNRFSNASARFDISNAVLQALGGDDILNIRVTLSSMDGAYTRLGAITIQYTGME